MWDLIGIFRLFNSMYSYLTQTCTLLRIHRCMLSFTLVECIVTWASMEAKPFRISSWMIFPCLLDEAENTMFWLLLSSHELNENPETGRNWEGADLLLCSSFSWEFNRSKEHSLTSAIWAREWWSCFDEKLNWEPNLDTLWPLIEVLPWEL